MVIFIEDGRLGNQLFQYSALLGIFRDEEIILLGFDEMFETLISIKAKQVLSNQSKTFRLIKYLVPILDTMLRSLSIIMSKLSILNKNMCNLMYFDFKYFKYVYRNYFQSENHIESLKYNALAIKDKYINKANEIIKKCIPLNCTPIFVHIRRTDYLVFPTRETSAALPVKWYQDCIVEYNKSYKNPFYIFCTDDVQFVKNNFDDISNMFISTNNYQIDFALMSQCHAGIISPSSFSWWGAYLAKKNTPEGRFVAPNYWIGHSNNEWYPKEIKSTFIEYRNVDDHSAVNE